jgi:putative transposase
MFGACRFIYNQMLEDKIAYYKKEKKMLNNTPAQYKNDNPWLKELDSYAFCNEQMNL